MENSAPTGRIFITFCIWVLSENVDAFVPFSCNQILYVYDDDDDDDKHVEDYNKCIKNLCTKLVIS
jgi:hypothetical protein